MPETLGPIDYFAIEFPDGAVTSAGFDSLLDLSNRGVILILDVEFIAKDGERASVVAVDSLDLPTGIDLSPWMGASSGILDDTDIAEIGAAMEPGSVAVVVVYENLWVIGLIDKWRQEGARLIADSGLPVEDVIAALDAAESR